MRFVVCPTKHRFFEIAIWSSQRAVASSSALVIAWKRHRSDIPRARVIFIHGVAGRRACRQSNYQNHNVRPFLGARWTSSCQRNTACQPARVTPSSGRFGWRERPFGVVTLLAPRAILVLPPNWPQRQISVPSRGGTIRSLSSRPHRAAAAIGSSLSNPARDRVRQLVVWPTVVHRVPGHGFTSRLHRPQYCVT